MELHPQRNTFLRHWNLLRLTDTQGRIQKFWKVGVRTFESQVRVKRGTTAEAKRLGVSGPLNAPRTPHMLDGLRCILSSRLFYHSVNFFSLPFVQRNFCFSINSLFLWGWVIVGVHGKVEWWIKVFFVCYVKKKSLGQ